MQQYNSAYDVGAIDIYPVSYPPGAHSDLPNKNISVVVDYAARMREVLQGEKPLWMVLQICWSGVLPSRGKVLRFPTFPEERYMSCEAIINGARGLNISAAT